MYACKPHWFVLPKPIRSEIWRTYKAGLSLDHPERLQVLRDARAFYSEHAKEAGAKKAAEEAKRTAQGALPI